MIFALVAVVWTPLDQWVEMIRKHPPVEHFCVDDGTFSGIPLAFSGAPLVDRSTERARTTSVSADLMIEAAHSPCSVPNQEQRKGCFFVQSDQSIY